MIRIKFVLMETVRKKSNKMRTVTLINVDCLTDTYFSNVFTWRKKPKGYVNEGMVFVVKPLKLTRRLEPKTSVLRSIQFNLL